SLTGSTRFFARWGRRGADSTTSLTGSTRFFARCGRRGADSTTSLLLDDLGDAAGADGAATLTDREPQTLVHRDRLTELDGHRHVVTRHHHLGTRRQLHRPRHIRGPEEELRPVVVEERLVTTTLL